MTIKASDPHHFAERDDARFTDEPSDRLAYHPAADDDGDRWARYAERRRTPACLSCRFIGLAYCDTYCLDQNPPDAAGKPQDAPRAPNLLPPVFLDVSTSVRPAGAYPPDLSKLTPEWLADYCTGEDDDL